MVRIRLQKPSRQKLYRKFNIVVTDSRRSRDGKPIASIGSYTMFIDGQKKLRINKILLEKFLYEGAQPTKSVQRLLRSVFSKLY